MEEVKDPQLPYRAKLEALRERQISESYALALLHIDEQMALARQFPEDQDAQAYIESYEGSSTESILGTASLVQAGIGITLAEGERGHSNEQEKSLGYAAHQEIVEFGAQLGHNLTSVSTLWTALLRGAEKKEYFERNKISHPEIASHYAISQAEGVDRFENSSFLVAIDEVAYELFRETNPGGDLLTSYEVNLDTLRLLFESPTSLKGFHLIGKTRRDLVRKIIDHKSTQVSEAIK